MKVFNFYFDNLPSRMIVAENFSKAYTILTKEEASTIKTVYTSDVTVVD